MIRTKLTFPYQEVKPIATTRIIPMHINKGRTIAKCLSDRIVYSKNPEKTDNGEYVSSFQCDPHTADEEFLLAKNQYKTLTGREQKNDVIAYQVRQSFRPGEVMPEEANRIGFEFAERFLKGKHAFLVATHTDKKHIHNHIIWNSTTLDCRHKYRDFLRSGAAVRKLSDLICTEHKLSVIENPKPHGKSYNKWQGEKAKPSSREQLRFAIDAAMEEKPKDIEDLLARLEKAGYVIKRGAHISLKPPLGKRFIRLDSLKGGYTQDYLIAVLAGTAEHKPRRKPTQKSNLLIDIQAKIQEGKGGGYIRWATDFNLKQMAKTLSYLTEHKLLNYQDLKKRKVEITDRYNILSEEIKQAEKRMTEIAVMKTHIIGYTKTRKVYLAYRKAGYSKKFHAEHEGEIRQHKTAKEFFDAQNLKKLPSVKNLQTEYAELLAKKKAAYSDYREAREELRELLIHESNVDRLLGNEADKDKKRTQGER